jgi:hypothetical protein
LMKPLFAAFARAIPMGCFPSATITEIKAIRAMEKVSPERPFS